MDACHPPSFRKQIEFCAGTTATLPFGVDASASVPTSKFNPASVEFDGNDGSRLVKM